MPTRTCTAVLFDIDGTLADTNYLHVDAWLRAFADAGRPVDAWRVHRAIGMDSAKLLEGLLDEDLDRFGDTVKELHRAQYAKNRSRMRTFDGARELLAELDRRGFRVVLATSAPPEEFEMLAEVLDAEQWVSTVTTASDVEQAKPEPDVIRVALDKAGVDASDAVMVGDAVWDVAAAKRAGVRCISVLSGGVGAAELRDSGAIAVYDDVAHLFRELDDSPLYES